MIATLARWFSRSQPEAVPAALPQVPVAMHWQRDCALVIADWERIGHQQPPDLDGRDAHIYWTSAAHAWLQVLGAQLGTDYRVRESTDFLLLSNLEPRPAEVFLQSCQRMLARIRRSLAELAMPQVVGKYVVMVFEDSDDYYAYVTHYYPEGGEYALSSGMFIQAGYGHFVMPMATIETMEPVIAHELTHCLLQHLPIPAWLNEGMAVNTEYTLFPQLAAPHAQLYFPHELAAQHAAYWNADSIQGFWSGRSFLASDEGNRLSYDLARKIVALAAADEPAFRAFVAAATLDDAGQAAAAALGYPLPHLLQAVLGPGDWAPRPECWNEGIERGQF